MADKEHELTLQFTHKVYGSAEKVEVARQWIERQIRVSLHTQEIVLVLTDDKIKDDTEPLPGLENV